MQVFQIRYRNTQGTLMRILTAVSRRGLDMGYVQAEPVGNEHEVTLLLEVNAKQAGQLCRDWHATVDVHEVRIAAAAQEVGNTLATAHIPPGSATIATIQGHAAMA